MNTAYIRAGILAVLVSVFVALFFGQAQVRRARGAGGGAQAPSAGTLVPNGGFEEIGEGGLPKGWQIMPNRDGRGDARLDGENAYAGKYSLRLAPNRRNTEEGFGVFTKLDPGALKGREITITGQAMLADLGEGGAAGLMLKTDRDDWLIFRKGVANKFTEFRKTLRISPEISQAYLFLIVGGKSGTAWIDELAITSTGGAGGSRAEVRQPLAPTNDEYSRKINTPGWQDSAFITADGTELYFAYMPYTSRDHRGILLGRITPEEVRIRGPIRQGTYNALEFETFKSVKSNDGTWAAPVRVYVEGANSFFAAKLSIDGSQMYYVMRDQPGGYGSGDIFVSDRAGDNTWGPPKNLGANINTDANEETPCVSADGNTLYFARNRGDGLGFELMSSHRVDGAWAKAEKMPYPLNERNPSRTANHQPFLTADGKDLYFTRIQQIFKSSRNPDGSWSAPAKVFPNLPLSGHASLTADGKYIFFLSVKDEQSIERENWSIWFSGTRADGTRGDARPVD